MSLGELAAVMPCESAFTDLRTFTDLPESIFDSCVLENFDIPEFLSKRLITFSSNEGRSSVDMRVSPPSILNVRRT